MQVLLTEEEYAELKSGRDTARQELLSELFNHLHGHPNMAQDMLLTSELREMLGDVEKKFNGYP